MNLRLWSFALLLGAIACAGRPRVLPVTAPEPEPVPSVTAEDSLRFAVADAFTRATGGEFGAADSLLLVFAASTDESCVGNEASYWRALLRLDPQSPMMAGDAAVYLLDSYLGSPCVSPWRAAEVAILRRVALDLAVAQQLAAAGASSTASTEQQLAEVRSELARTKLELERIRRRVIPPRGGNGRGGRL